MVTRLHFQVDEETAAYIQKVAQEEGRSVSNLLALIVTEYLLERSQADMRALKRMRLPRIDSTELDKNVRKLEKGLK